MGVRHAPCGGWQFALMKDREKRGRREYPQAGARCGPIMELLITYTQCADHVIEAVIQITPKG